MQSTTTIEPSATLLEITERYPSTIQVFVEAGFAKMRDPEKRRTQGKALTLEAAAKLRKLDLESLIGRLARAAKTDVEQQQDLTLTQPTDGVTLRPEGDVRLAGLLPCPVRLPILEAVGQLASELEASGTKLGWSLAAASVGADSLNDQIAAIEDEADLPDVFVSAGFESFFDHRNLGRFGERGTFVDVAPAGQNPSFGDLQLRDPEGRFTMIAVVPAVFIVNDEFLGGAPAPRTWEDLLDERLADRIALPVGDFDLFNALLIYLHRRFGSAGVEGLARNMLTSLHPSQAVGRFARKQAQPGVSVVPYFFSRMTMGAKGMSFVWPEDGAVISPVFLLLRRNAHPDARRVADLLASKQVGEILAHKGNFPSLHPDVDNRLPEGATFDWLGWSYVRDNDLGAMIPELRASFDALVRAKAESDGADKGGG